jgi:nitroreductase
MDKPATTAFPVNELIRMRWSPMAFAERRVSREVIGSLLEAARWAPSCFNEQPWRFVIGAKDDPEQFERLADCLMPGNRDWAGDAPVLLLSVASQSFERNGKPNDWAEHDVGLATAQLILQAESLGLVAHPMAGFDPAKARNSFQIPEGNNPVAMIALGYPGELESLPEGMHDRERAPRARRALAEFAFSGSWGQPF